MNNIEQKFLLLQINDALFPIGTYIHSYGLETYVQHELVTDASSMQEWLTQYMTSAFLYSELLAVKLAYEQTNNHDLAAVDYLEKFFLTAKAPLELRQAAIKLGSRFIKTVQSLPLPSIDDNFYHYISQSRLHAHPIAYGVFCSAADIALPDSCLHYIYAQAASLINTCVKSIPLSQTSGQQILRSCSVQWPQLLDKLHSLSIDDFCLSTPGFDIRAMQHETLYSRLYMS
ncbi:urease accessory protein UreF [Pectinatus frisingensis]|uniref:urease accessory protein UreF n=1 Tax=Pectinatus frisingensis TaxID=865 RepID=UPI0018C6951E|nr:urease accessory protein UreF [Pectinatus frisingensis]